MQLANITSKKGLLKVKNLSQEQVIEQMRTNTLFHYKINKPHHILNKNKTELEQTKNQWIDQITLGLQDDLNLSLQNKQSHANQDNHSMFKCPSLLQQKSYEGKLPQLSKKQHSKHQTSNRCSKLACLQRKYYNKGAWNQSNKNNIQKSIQRLQQSLQLNRSELIQNDFRRVDGLGKSHIKQNLDFKDYIQGIEKNKSVLQTKIGFNPFKKLSVFTESLNKMYPQKKIIKNKNRNRNKYDMEQYTFVRFKKDQNSIRSLNEAKVHEKQRQNHFLPKFLLTSLHFK